MIDLFIAYSHNDLHHKDELKKFLRPLLREGRISMWDDFDIEAGQDWDAAIKQRLYSAELVLLLVSADSLASDYFYGKEVEVSLERHKRGEAVVVPVILRHCDWTETPLGSLEALPEKGRPVVDWPTRDQALQDVVSRLRRVVEGIEQKRKAEDVQAEARRQFGAAIEAADYLFQKKKWNEARVAYASALTAHQPGFIPDRPALLAKIADCDAQLVTLAAEARRIQETEPKQAKEAEEYQKSVEEAGFVKGRKPPPEWIQLSESSASKAPSSTTRLLVGIGIGALLVLVVLLWRPWRHNDKSQDRSMEPVKKDTVAPAIRPSQTEEKRTQLSSQPDTKKQEKIARLLQEANTFIKLDEPKQAKKLLQEVLQLDPDNKTAKEKLRLLK